MKLLLSSSLALLAPLGIGCVDYLPPAATPAAVAPEMSQAAPPAGTGRLVVDVVDGPTQVQRLRMVSQEYETAAYGADATAPNISWVFTEASEVLCPTSPCVLDEAPGNVILSFPVLGTDVFETELVHLSLEPTVYRRSLSVYEDDTGAGKAFGILLTTLGGVAAATGIPLLAVGLGNEDDGLTLAGAITLGSGALLMTLGTLLITGDAATFRPGSANHFPLGSTQITAGD